MQNINITISPEPKPSDALVYLVPGVPCGAILSLAAIAKAQGEALLGQWTLAMRDLIALSGKLDSKRLGLSEVQHNELLSALDGICNDIAQVSQEVAFSVSKG